MLVGVMKSQNETTNTDGWLLRAQVAELLDVSHTTVKNWDGNLLHPQKSVRSLPNGGSREVWVYDPHEVAKVPAARRQRARTMPGDRGEIAAQAFELLDEGMPLREVVQRLRETPEAVDILYDQWQRMGGSELVIGRLARAELVKLVGPFDGVSSLVGILRELLDTKTATSAATPTATGDDRGTAG